MDSESFDKLPPLARSKSNEDLGRNTKKKIFRQQTLGVISLAGLGKKSPKTGKNPFTSGKSVFGRQTSLSSIKSQCTPGSGSLKKHQTLRVPSVAHVTRSFQNYDINGIPQIDAPLESSDLGLQPHQHQHHCLPHQPHRGPTRLLHKPTSLNTPFATPTMSLPVNKSIHLGTTGVQRRRNSPPYKLEETIPLATSAPTCSPGSTVSNSRYSNGDHVTRPSLGNHAPCPLDHGPAVTPTITVTMNGGGGPTDHGSPRSDDHYVDARTGDARHDSRHNTRHDAAQTSASTNCDHQHLHAEHFIGDNISLYGMHKDWSSTVQMPAPEQTDGISPKSISSTTHYIRDQLVAFFQPSDNKLAMKLFGNRNALIKEKIRQKATGNWVIHPCSDFRFYWDLFMLILLIANLIILPVAISFFNDDLSLRWIIFNSVSDTVFILDLIINFRTGIIADNFVDEIILEPREIARRYFKTWFFLDLVSSLPLDYLILLFSPAANVTQLLHAGRALRIFRLVKLLSLLRLLRLSRLVRYISQWEEFINVASKFMRIVNLVCLMLLLGHWNACLLWLVAVLQEFPADSWVSTNELQHAHWLEQYTWALFKALSHMLCIGYGRYPPQSTTDVWLTIISMLTGATCYALFVGHATTLIQSFDTSKRLYREKFKQVEEYMSYRKLPRNLRQQINDYYEHRYQGKMFDEERILGELNDCLRESIINFNCRALVASVPFFAHADPTFVSEIVSKLQYEVFLPGEYIIREGTVGTKMYYIQEGIVDIVTKDGEVATSLSDGSYFGEICLLTNAKRVASVRSETYCNLFSLSVQHFNSVLEHYPLVRRTMESVAAERLNKIGENPSMVSNRNDMKDDISAVNMVIDETTPLVSSESETSVSSHAANTDMLHKARQVLKKCRSENDFQKISTSSALK